MLAKANALKAGDLPGKAGPRSWRAGSSETGLPTLVKCQGKARPAEVRVPIVARKGVTALERRGAGRGTRDERAEGEDTARSAGEPG